MLRKNSIIDNQSDPELLLDSVIIVNTIIVSIPVLLLQPLWVGLSALLLWILLILIKLKYITNIRPWVLSIVSAFFFYLVYTEYKTLIGQEPGSALLTLLAALKLYEIRSHRDRIVHLLLTICIVMAWSVDIESIVQTVFMLFCFLFTCSLFKAIQLNPKNIKGYLFGFKLSLKAFLYSLPILFVFFFFFPRFVSPFTRYLPSNAANSGFNDTLQPGDITKIVKSQEVAFRIKFSPGTKQLKKFLYWRGTILDQTDGFKWWRDKNKKNIDYVNSDLLNVDLKKPFNAEVFYENRFEGWLFHFDNTKEITPLYPNERLRIVKREGGTYQHTGSPLSRLRYNFSFQSESFKTDDKASIVVPTVELSSEIKSLSQELLSQSKNRSEAAQLILNYFKSNNFKYTAEPGPIESLDDFLFKKKLGFCEHYATATAVLLNQMNIPARVVMGFHGGTLNTYGFYWVVRDQDAHAWVEYFSEEKKWVRLDATSVVAPLRLEFGGSILAETTNYEEDLNSFLKEYESSWLKKISNEAFLFLDNLDNQYTMFMLNYDFYSQIEIIRNLGLEIKDRSGLIAILITLLVFSFLFLRFLLTYKRIQTEELLKTYLDFCNVIEKKTSIQREAHQGPLEYKKNVTKIHPELTKYFDSFYRVYFPLRYGGNSKNQKNIKTLKNCISDLKSLKVRTNTYT